MPHMDYIHSCTDLPQFVLGRCVVLCQLTAGEVPQLETGGNKERDNASKYIMHYQIVRTGYIPLSEFIL